MKRWIILGLVILSLFVGFVGSLYWLMGTTEGAHWVIGAISRWTSVKIEVQKISGQIGHKLRMEELRVYWPGGEVKVEEFNLRWQPLYLLMGKATIEELALQGVQIQDNRPEIKTAPDLEWPTAPGLSLWIHGEVKNLHVREFLYQRQSHNPLNVERLAARLNWSYGLLTLEKMDLEVPSGVVKGTVELGLMRPGLCLDLNLSPAKAMDGIDSINLNSRLLQARGPEQVAGNVMIEGRSGPVRRFLIETEIGLTRTALHFQNLVLSRPGRQGHFTGHGRISFTADEVMTSLEMQFFGLDLSKDLGIKTAFSGILHVEGRPDDYRGDIRIENTKGKWYSGYLSGTFKGGLQGAQVTILGGSMLDGNFQGYLNAQWGEGLSLKGSLQARNHNPAGITPDWDGRINLDLEGTFRWPKENSPEGRLSARLLTSHLRGQQLTGDVELHVEKSILRIARADLKGKGFDLFARGVLQERLSFNADINDLSGLIPGTRGSFLAKGWIRWRSQHLAMDFNGQGKDLFMRGIELGAADLSTRFDEREEAPVELKGRFLRMAYKSFRADSVTLDASGKLSRHRMIFAAHSPEGRIKSTFEGNYSKEGWQGKITQLSGSDAIGDWKLQAPAEIGVSSRHIKVKSLQISSIKGENLQFNGDFTLRPLRGTLQAEWYQLNFARANPWLGTPRLTGHTTGDFSIQWLEEDRLKMAGMVNLAGTFTDSPLKVDLSRGLVKFDWSEKGLSALWELEDAKSGKLRGNLSSPQPARMALPQEAKLNARWEAIDLGVLRLWLPSEMGLEGRLFGNLSGQYSNRQFDTVGAIRISEGVVNWKHEAGSVNAPLRTAELTWNWRDDHFGGEVSLILADYGHVKGHFQLPLVARFPVTIRPKGPIQVSLNGQVEEKGLLPAFFPGIVQESRGQIHLNLTGNGTWEKPNLLGSMKLEKAGGYLPAAGIRLEDMSTEAQFGRDQIRITSFKTRSGPGHLDGAATIWLENWKVSRYEGSLRGDRFQTVYFPELQVWSAPRLNFHGTTKRISVRGEIKLPEALILSTQTSEIVRPSPDILIVDAPEVSKKGPSIELDIQVRLLLGEKVFLKANGADARLTGTVALMVQDAGQVNAEGEIRVAEGHYNIYGQRLEITRGRLIFTRGPIDNPVLDALAVRKVKEVQAGVVVAGTLEKPVVRLYSRPAMADPDILSYIILGQPLGSNKEQAPSLMKAAAGLLTAGESVVLQGQLQKLLGLDVVDIEAGEDGISRAMVTIGKYLAPKLYISLGRSLFTEATFFTIRYALSKRLEIETRAGTETGGTIYYKIEFR